MRRVAWIALALAATGCASIIGASFDDAGLYSGDEESEDAATQEGASLDSPNAEGSDAGSFDPSSLQGLALWLDANDKVDVADGGSAVVRWHDKSNNGRDAVPAGAGTNPPSRVPNALNGLPVVHFTQSQLDLLVTPWNGPGGTAITMFLVTRGYPQSALRFQANINNYPFLIFPVDSALSKTNPLFIMLVGSTSPNVISLNVPIDGGATIASARWTTNGTADTYTNGTLDEQRFTNLPLPNALLYIGGVLPLLTTNQTAPFADGDIAEAIVYTNALADSDRVKVEAYLRAKWAIGP